MTKTRRAGTVRQLVIAALFSFIASATLAQDQTPVSVTVVPGAKQIPANILRLYINFSEPMRRRQVARHIYLEDHKGHAILNPFLNLGTELWNEDQTRLTLLFDPGRIKQGVGPNVRYGPPLNEGETVSLVVRKEMKSVNGVSLAKRHRTSFSVGAAERRPVDPLAWRLNLPQKETSDALEIAFDRLMDVGAASRLIRVRQIGGEYLAGDVLCNGSTWRFQPSDSWAGADYEIVVHPSLEDISGNTPYAEFDTMAGTSAEREGLVSLRFRALSDAGGS